MRFVRLRQALMLGLGLAVAAAAPSLAASKPNRVEIGNLVVEGIPEIPQTLADRTLQYQNARAAYFADFAPDGGVLIATRFGEALQVHKVDFPLAARTQLTFYPEPTTPVVYRPNAATFLFSKDKGGDENYQVYSFDPASGETTQLTQAGTRNEEPTYSRDGSLLVWTVSSQDSSKYQIVSAPADNPAARAVRYEADGAWFAADISPDNKTLLLQKYVSINESHLYLLDEAGKLTELNPSRQKIAYEGAQFSADGTKLYTVLDQDSEFLRLAEIDVASGQTHILTADTNWDVESFDVADNGKALAYVVNEGGISKLHILELPKLREIKLPDLPAGVISDLRFSPDAKRLGFSLNSAVAPSDVYTIDANGKKLTRWTKSEIGGLNPEKFATPQLVEFPTFDSAGQGPKNIPAFVYKPSGSGRFPVVVSIHGGPEAQARPEFDPARQFWISELGAAVIEPNVRGSSGYGKTSLTLDNGTKREDSVKDIGALLDWIATQSDLDSSRVIVEGGSYGGYMVLASLVHYNDRLAGGIDEVGISNFVTFLTNTSGYRQDLRRAEYGDERDPKMREFLTKISPLTSIKKVTKPMLVIQGFNDPRVPVTEAEQVIGAVRANGGNAWYLMAKDEGHGFRKKANRDYRLNAVALFLEEVLAAKPRQ